MDKKEHSSQKE